MLWIESAAGNSATSQYFLKIASHGIGTLKDVNFIPVSSFFAFGIPLGMIFKGLMQCRKFESMKVGVQV